MEFTDRTALVTGAAHGIGRTTAERLASEGATVVVADVDATAGEETATAIEDAGGTAVFQELDVTDLDAFESVVDATVAEFGLDVLVNNAGVGHDAALLEDTPRDDLDHLLAVNVRGVWNGCHAALPHLKGQGSGSVVNVSSLAGVVGAPRLATYSLTKGAVLNFTRAVAAEAGGDGVRVNAVCPGFVNTRMADEFFADTDDPDATRERMERQYPLGRLGDPEEIAAAIRWLASEEASWVTGHGLVVDGGFSAY